MATTTVTRENVEPKVIEAIAELGPEPAQVTPDATFESLDVDSLDLVELTQVVEEEFGVVIPNEDAAKLTTVGEAIEYVVAHGS
ncbi:MAG: acyl carrier protein [Thermoleophilaceae bacterium]|jgi:acyl carrier protein